MPFSATLEIHQINVGQGDCTLILARDLDKLKNVVAGRDANVANGNSIDHLPYCLANNLTLHETVQNALLVDAGNDGYGPDVREYLVRVGAINPGVVYQGQLSMLATHYHDDHQDGLRSVMRDALNAQDIALRRGIPGADTTKEVHRPATFYRIAPDPKRDRSMGMFPAILQELANQSSANTPRTTVIALPRGGGNLIGRGAILLGTGVDGLPIKVIVLACDQAHLDQANGLAEIPNKNARKKGRPLSENDRSIVLMVEYGSFRHFLGGDIGGATCSIEADVEGALAAALPMMLPAMTAQNGPKISAPAHCCSVKLSHHGSRHSNTDAMLTALSPRIAVGSSGFRQYFHGHPNAEVVTRMSTRANLIQRFATEIASKGKGKPFDPDPNRTINILGDIIIRPVDESVSERHRAATVNAGSPLQIQVYGTGVQSWIDQNNLNYALRPASPTTPGVKAGYSIGPYEILCNGH